MALSLPSACASTFLSNRCVSSLSFETTAPLPAANLGSPRMEKMQGSCILRDSLLMGRAGQRREGLYKAGSVGVHRLESASSTVLGVLVAVRRGVSPRNPSLGSKQSLYTATCSPCGAGAQRAGRALVGSPRSRQRFPLQGEQGQNFLTGKQRVPQAVAEPH